MANCCICGTKLGFLDGDIPLSPCYKEMKICRICKAERDCLETIEKHQNINNYKSEKERLEKKLQDLQSDQVKKELKSFIEACDEKLKGIGIYCSEEEKQREQEIIRGLTEEVVKKKKAFLYTTGYNYEGYKIKKYLNVVHGEVVLGTGFFSEISASVNDLFGTTSGSIEGKLSKAKRMAQEQMINNAIIKGANALIGVDYDVTTLANNMMVVSANGTAVVIEFE